MRTIFTFLCLLLFIAGVHAQTNFSSDWLLDKAKSDFQRQSPQLVFNELKVIQTVSVLTVNGARENETNTVAAYPMDGSDIKADLAGGRKMRAYVNWSEDKTALIRASSYFTGNSPIVDYTSNENWRLSSDGKTLTLSRGPFGQQPDAGDTSRLL